MSLPAQALGVLEFWFGSDPADFGSHGKAFWFVKNANVDAAIRRQFLPLYEEAVAGQLSAWQESARGSLALIIVLDQFSRNMFRDQPRAFSADSLARQIASQAIEHGFDSQLSPLQRAFMYLPFEHSEERVDQERSLALFDALADHAEAKEMVRYAHLHYDVIDRFGRFPHRNAILGRESNDAERQFLTEPGSAF